MQAAKPNATLPSNATYYSDGVTELRPEPTVTMPGASSALKQQPRKDDGTYYTNAELTTPLTVAISACALIFRASE